MLLFKAVIRVLGVLASSAGTFPHRGSDGTTSGSSGNPITIEIQGSNGRWTFAGSSINNSAAISAAMQRALNNRRDAQKARAVDARSGIVVDFSAR